MAWFRCLGNGGSSPLIPYRDYLGQLIPRVSASTLKITESGHDSSYYGWYAFDGIESSNLSNPDHCWLATNGDADAYIQYEFNRVFWFNKLAIKCFSNYSDDWVGNIKVLGSTDGVNWENILANGTNIEVTAKYQEMTYIEIDLNDSSEYQYIRIQADNNAFTVYYSPSIFFDEIYVYGGVIGSYLNYKEGEFVTSNVQYGIVDVEVGFKPDLLVIELPFSNNVNGTTVATWEKNATWAETHSVWAIPSESKAVYTELNRYQGEAGIQSINENGFSFKSQAQNTRNKTCKYMAVKYKELPLNMNILKGLIEPSSNLGSNGQIYLKYGLVGSLLHFDDSVTKDENGNTWSTYGSSATLSTEQSKFGGKSLYLNGSDYLQSNISDDFNFGSNDFTITCWIYPTTRTRMAVFAMSADLRIGTDIFFGQNSANMWMSSSGSSWNILQSDTSGANTGQGTIPLNANEWTHLAYVRNGANIRMYVNGQVARDVTLSDINTKVYYSGNNGFRIGSWGNDQYRFAGYIDEFLVCNGVALWTDTFTPPTEPFTLNDFNLVTNTYVKVNNTWQDLIGADVNDIRNTTEN